MLALFYAETATLTWRHVLQLFSHKNLDFFRQNNSAQLSAILAVIRKPLDIYSLSFGSQGPSIGNGLWGIKWSRDR